MKKVLAILLSAILLLSLFGCSKDDSNDGRDKLNSIEGAVVEVYDNAVLLKTDQGELIVAFDNNTKFKNMDRLSAEQFDKYFSEMLTVYYDGEIQETYPLKIDKASIISHNAVDYNKSMNTYSVLMNNDDNAISFIKSADEWKKLDKSIILDERYKALEDKYDADFFKSSSLAIIKTIDEQDCYIYLGYNTTENEITLYRAKSNSEGQEIGYRIHILELDNKDKILKASPNDIKIIKKDI